MGSSSEWLVLVGTLLAGAMLSVLAQSDWLGEVRSSGGNRFHRVTNLAELDADL